MRMMRWSLAGLMTTALAVPLQAAHADPSPQARAAVTRPTSAVAALNQLPRKGRAPMTGYSRARFGQAWTDDVAVPGGHNGCDTRNDILRRDLVATRLRSGGCKVAVGTLNDPYTGRRISFTSGLRTSTAVQIDHLVALGDAWQTGAQGWPAAKRTQLANDPLNLLAVDGPTNEGKGDGDAASWLPRKAFRCAYVARQVAVKRKYGLWVTTAEGAAMARVLRACPAAALPTTASTAVPAVNHAKPKNRPTPKPHPKPKPRSAPKPRSGSVYYPNCAAVRAAGKAPLRRGQPGYRPGLDRDGDGIACDRG